MGPIIVPFRKKVDPPGSKLFKVDGGAPSDLTLVVTVVFDPRFTSGKVKLKFHRFSGTPFEEEFNQTAAPKVIMCPLAQDGVDLVEITEGSVGHISISVTR